MWEKTFIQYFDSSGCVVKASDSVMTNIFDRIEKIIINPLKCKLVAG